LVRSSPRQAAGPDHIIYIKNQEETKQTKKRKLCAIIVCSIDLGFASTLLVLKEEKEK
jgi:hypothetical protein